MTRQPSFQGQTKVAQKSSSRNVPRISITVSQSIHDLMLQECTVQGRSLSNLASFWIKQQAEAVALEQGKTIPEA
jgi:tRNA(Ile)-lysidine synthase TilS/MesJ